VKWRIRAGGQGWVVSQKWGEEIFTRPRTKVHRPEAKSGSKNGGKKRSPMRRRSGRKGGSQKKKGTAAKDRPHTPQMILIIG